MIIQPTPKRSVSVAKNVLPSGICTCPPVAERLEHAVGLGFVLGIDGEREALEVRLALRAPSDAITAAPLMRRHACLVLSSLPGGTRSGGGGCGLSDCPTCDLLPNRTQLISLLL